MTAVEAVVCVPVRDEEERLPALCGALAAQVDLLGRPLPDRALHLVLLLNNCGDDSPRVAATEARRHKRRLTIHVVEKTLKGRRAHVGHARRAAMDIGAAILVREGAAGGALLTTDADALPAPDWVAANLAALSAGAELVGGALYHMAEEASALSPAVLRTGAKLRVYRQALDSLEAALDPVEHDPLPRHWDHTGASMAITAATYRRVGGLPPLPCREDLALVSEVRRHGGRVRHAPEVRVAVSTRLAGRAAGGMADTLRTWEESALRGTPILVEDPAEAARRFLCRATLRALFRPDAGEADREALCRTADLIRIEPARLASALRRAGSGTALAEALLPDGAPADPTMPLDAALRVLRERLPAAAEQRHPRDREAV